MSRNYSGGKRQREAERDRRKKEKEERLRRNRQGRPPADSSFELAAAEPLPAVALEDVVISVPARPRERSLGPIRLFVGGLNGQTTADTLRSAFSRFGTIEEATV